MTSSQPRAYDIDDGMACINADVLNGNIFAQLRNKVRSEAAEHFKSMLPTTPSSSLSNIDSFESAFDSLESESQFAQENDLKRSASQNNDSIRLVVFFFILLSAKV